MNFVFWKQVGVLALISINVALLAWAFMTHRQRRSLPEGYYRLLPVSSTIASFQVAMGLYFLLEGRQALLMHIFYGSAVAMGALLQHLLRLTTATGQTYRAKPLIHAALALFVALLAVRSWMSG